MTNQGTTIQGKAYYCGDYVNTDVMSPGRFEPYDGPEHLASIALIDYESPSGIPFVRPGEKRSDYTVIVAGTEFGCGSSRETPQALHHAGASSSRGPSRASLPELHQHGLAPADPIAHDWDERVIGTEVRPGAHLHARRHDVLFPTSGRSHRRGRRPHAVEPPKDDARRLHHRKDMASPQSMTHKVRRVGAHVETARSSRPASTCASRTTRY